MAETQIKEISIAKIDLFRPLDKQSILPDSEFSNNTPGAQAEFPGFVADKDCPRFPVGSAEVSHHSFASEEQASTTATWPIHISTRWVEPDTRSATFGTVSPEHKEVLKNMFQRCTCLRGLFIFVDLFCQRRHVYRTDWAFEVIAPIKYPARQNQD
jgi:hypothetical protein